MRFSITDHAVARYQERIQEVTYAEAERCLEVAMSHANRTKVTAAGGGELWHFKGDPPFVAVCARDSFHKHDWVVRTIITEAQAFKENVSEVESEIVDEIYADAQKDVSAIAEFTREPVPLIATQLARAPKHLQPILSQCAKPADLSRVVTIVQIEQAKWRETQKTLRTQATEAAREQSYRELLRAIIRLTVADSSSLAQSIRKHVSDVAPGMLTPAFHGLPSRERKIAQREIDLDVLQRTIERLLSLLKDRQFGLVTWHIMLADGLREIGAISGASGVRE